MIYKKNFGTIWSRMFNAMWWTEISRWQMEHVFTKINVFFYNSPGGNMLIPHSYCVLNNNKRWKLSNWIRWALWINQSHAVAWCDLGSCWGLWLSRVLNTQYGTWATNTWSAIMSHMYLVDSNMHFTQCASNSCEAKDNTIILRKVTQGYPGRMSFPW